MTVERIAEKVRAGERLNAAEALGLYRRAPTSVLGELANVRVRKHPDGIVTYIIDPASTTRTSASRGALLRSTDPSSPEGYVLGFDELFRKIDETIAVGVQLLLQEGTARFA